MSKCPLFCVIKLVHHSNQTWFITEIHKCNRGIIKVIIYTVVLACEVQFFVAFIIPN